MKHYLDINLLSDMDITLLSDSEPNLGFIWQKVYQQIHIALVENKAANGGSTIAVSFPEYGNKPFPLGAKLRLLAESQEQLIKLDVGKWLNRLNDYCHFTPIKEVPLQTIPVRFNQSRVKGEKRIVTSLIRKARHISNKFNIDFEECLAELKAKHKFVESTLPFIRVESLSGEKNQQGSKQSFKLFIEKVDCDEPSGGSFDCYGLSKIATVPWF